MIQTVQNKSRPIMAADPPARPSRFRNERGQTFHFAVVALHRLGVLGKIALVFSKRCMDMAALRFSQIEGGSHVHVHITVEGSHEQMQGILRELTKIIDVTEVNISRARPADAQSNTTAPMEELTHVF